MFSNKAKAYIKGGKAFPKINGLPQSNDHCKRKIFWFSHP